MDGPRKKNTSVSRLKRNDWIVCPADGVVEQITAKPHRYSKDRRAFRTSRHDHIRNYSDRIIVVVKDAK